jgi:hypothetical protein
LDLLKKFSLVEVARENEKGSWQRKKMNGVETVKRRFYAAVFCAVSFFLLMVFSV